MNAHFRYWFIMLALFLILPGQTLGGNYSRVDEDEHAPLGRRSQTFARPAVNPEFRMTEALHKEFMENKEYSLADGLLNTTWGLLKANLSKSEYQEALESQRAWVKSGRDTAAATLLPKMSAVQAYDKVIRERADYLASLIAKIPRDGTFSSDFGSFKVYSADGTMEVEGNSFHGMNTCDFNGTGSLEDGWIQFLHPDASDFYVLFTKNGATIFYNSSELDQGCGMNAGFDGTYKFKK